MKEKQIELSLTKMFRKDKSGMNIFRIGSAVLIDLYFCSNWEQASLRLRKSFCLLISESDGLRKDSIVFLGLFLFEIELLVG